MEKTLIQAGTAAGTGVVAEYAEKGKLFGETLSGGLVAAAGIAALAYFMAPTARGTTVQMTGGAIDGAATWLALKYLAPALGVKGRSAPVYRSAPMGQAVQRSSGMQVEI